MGKLCGVRAAGAAAAVLLGAGACAHYQPAPLDLAAYPDRAAARTLDQPPGAVWSPLDLLSRAVAANPAVAAAESRYRTAAAASRAARVPPGGAGLTLSAEYADEAAHWLFGFITDVPLDVGARRSARLAAADVVALQALHDVAAALWTVRSDLTRAVVERTEAARALPTAARAVALRRERVARLDRRVAAGEDARPDTDLARSELFAAERRLAEVQARAAAADAALSRALAVSPQAVAGLRLSEPAPAPGLGALAAWRNEAALGRPEILRAVADYDTAEAGLRLEVARQRPEIRLGPGYSWDHGVNKLPFNLSLILPPIDLNRAAIAEAEARRAEAGRALEAAQAGVLAGVDQAAAALTAATEAERRARADDVPLARRGVAAAQRALAAGESDRLDALAAEAVLAEAELAALDARRLLALATAELEDSLRRPFDPAEGEVLARAVAEVRDRTAVTARAEARR